MLELTITAREADLGHGLKVRRVLPFARRRMVGPFIFWDHAGPVTLPPQSIRGADVRPHPHIGLATVSYLLSGSMTHRDSLGTVQVIRPGDVNWMTAGRGISHSERFSHPDSFAGGGLELLQSWVALPAEFEETEPAFAHTPQLVVDGEVGVGTDYEALQRRHLAEEHTTISTAWLIDHVGVHDGYSRRAGCSKQRFAVGSRLLDAGIERRTRDEIGLDEVDDQQRRPTSPRQSLAEAAAGIVVSQGFDHRVRSLWQRVGRPIVRPYSRAAGCRPRRCVRRAPCLGHADVARRRQRRDPGACRRHACFGRRSPGQRFDPATRA